MAPTVTDDHGLDDFIPIEQAPDLLPGKPHVSTLHRWRTRGVQGVRLATVRLGGRRLVSRAALIEFITSLTSVVDGDSAAAAKSRISRHRTVDVAEREVDRRFARRSKEARR